MFASCEAEREPAGKKPKSDRPPPQVAPFGLLALWRAYRACRKGKRTARDTQAYEASLLDKLVASRDALANPSRSGSWRPSRTFSFVVMRQATAGGAQGTLGYVTRPFYRLARRRVVKRLQTCLGVFERQHVRSHALELPAEARETLRAQLSSYAGHLRHANSQRLWQRTLLQYPWLAQVFVLPVHTPRVTALRLLPPAASLTNLADQYRYFVALHSGARALMQVGKNWMLWGACPPGLPQGCTVQRPGLGPCTEWPLAALPLLRQCLKSRGVAHQVVSQTGHFKTGFKQRALIALWLTPAPNLPPFLSNPHSQPLRA